MSAITFSIIMPAYGVEAYIGQAIESVLAQTVSDWELIVVNDGAIDGTRRVAQLYAEKDKRIRIVDKPNGGLSDARNFGLKEAKGEYVHFFDSDDWVAPDFYQRFLEAFSAGEDFLISAYVVEKEIGEDRVQREEKHCPSVEFPTITMDQSIDELLPFLNFAWNKVYRREFLVKNGLLFTKGLSRVEDCEFFARVLVCQPRFKAIDYAGYHYIVRPRTTLSNYWDAKMLEHCCIRMQATAHIYKALGCSAEKQCALLANCAEVTARAYLHQLFTSSKGKSLKFLWQSTKEICSLKEIKEALQRHTPRTNILIPLIKHSQVTAIVFLYYLKHRMRKA